MKGSPLRTCMTDDRGCDPELQHRDDGLWAAESMRHVLAKVVAGWHEVGTGLAAEWRVPSTAAIVQARRRAGARLLRELLDAVAGPVATPRLCWCHPHPVELGPPSPGARRTHPCRGPCSDRLANVTVPMNVPARLWFRQRRAPIARLPRQAAPVRRITRPHRFRRSQRQGVGEHRANGEERAPRA